MSTSYTQQVWQALSVGATPITETALNHIESGLSGAHNRIDVLAIGAVLTPTALQTSGAVPAPGQFVSYNATSASIGPIALPAPTTGAIMGVAKGDTSANTVTFTSAALVANGGSSTITLRTLGDSRVLYGTASAWYVHGTQGIPVGTAAGTVAAGNDSRFGASGADSLVRTALFGGSARTVAPFCDLRSNVVSYGVTNTDIFQVGVVVSAESEASTMLTAGTSNVSPSYLTIPLSGRYRVHYKSMMTTTGAGALASHVTLNTPNVTSSVCSADVTVSSARNEQTMDAVVERVFTAGDKLYAANWSSAPGTAVWQSLFGTPTQLFVRWVSPT